MKLYRVAVILTPAGGSRWHTGESYLAVGETPAEAGRRAMETYAAGNPHGLAPVGAAAEEIEGMAHALAMDVQAIQLPELRKLAKNPGWVAYDAPSSAPRP
ncbi:MAG: hypothetical protein K2Y56_21210 [Methylobacterium sp.]|uniref:hypothetical protein n=1 Tax=Methylobacterium sp. TaxID=409 RepID=UPI0025D41AF2|nr:hypothetical protein [Methylobacterium sp.]MBX9934005.1 hypothetical protein [Methylobacterium sp.]